MKQPGIYLLASQGVVIYVGKTTNIDRRLRYHDVQMMPYDVCRFVPCAEDKMDHYEQRWIKWFHPTHNSAHNKEKSVSPKIKVTSIKRRMKFRRLSELSRIGFGPLRDTTVERLLKSNKQLTLAKLYYQLSHISFLPEVLVKIGIEGEWVIEKPGVAKEKYFDFAMAKYPEQLEERIARLKKFEYDQSRMVLASAARGTWSKEYNRNRNQHRK